MKTATTIPCRPATEEECRIIRQLKRCNFCPGFGDTRFAHVMNAALTASANAGEPLEITDKQGEYLVRLAHRYRRQISGRK